MQKFYLLCLKKLVRNLIETHELKKDYFKNRKISRVNSRLYSLLL